MKKAFTLIELLMVVALIAIVSTLAVSKLGGVREGAARKVSLANQKAVERAVEAYLVNGGR
ncbi:MAG: type II secretion system protein, partial [Kiritimatiellae bacterium]|nr:type II secretion system protein [Kiritimatiellia bacterium]